VQVDVVDRFLEPSNIVLRAYYRIGTGDWGTWSGENMLAMTAVATNGNAVTYRTTGTIPAQSIDSVVQYYVEATYDGLFSEYASPKTCRTFTHPSWYHPVNLNQGEPAPVPYYIVFSCRPGEVWINEVNIVEGVFSGVTATQYIELAGLAGVNIGNWNVSILNTSFVRKGLYSIAGGTTLDNQDGFGFWVLGETNMGSKAQMYLTNTIPEYGGVRLIRSMGAYEDGVCFGDSDAAENMTNNPAQRMKYAGHDDAWVAVSPLALEGTGSNKTDFTVWLNDKDHTPGGVNVNQTLVKGNGPPETIEIEISAFWRDGNELWMVFNGTNDMDPTPWYSTNLMVTDGWTEVTDDTYTYGSGVYTQRFGLMTNAPGYYYKVTATVP
jgi:hypothetical protein